jgi:beta-N-acetylhexosaminidase
MKPMRTAAVLVMLMIFAQARGQKPELAPEDRLWVTQTLAAMTLEEKIGQMIVPSLTAGFTNVESDAYQEIERNISRYHVGGYHAFAGDPVGLALLLNRMQQSAKVPLLITGDLEGGPGLVYVGATRLPRAMALGAAGSEELAYEAGRITAVEGRALGIDVDFYPVVDVNNNPANPIINIRSFGEDPNLVSRLGSAYVRGVQENGELATAKHFPGHGDTSADSHLELPVVDVNRERLDQIELRPFRAAIEAGVGAVMVAHIFLPQLEAESGVPASLSKAITTGLLRTDLGFAGLVFTDAMTMQGVAGRYTPEQAAVRAVRAGVDVILLPVDVPRTLNALRRAVTAGEISEGTIEGSARRILEAKARLGLHKNRIAEIARIDEVLCSAQHRKAAQTMMERAITLVRDEKGVVPLNLKETSRVLVVTIMDSTSGWREGVPGTAFRQEFQRSHRNIISVQVDERTSKDALDILKKLADVCDVVVANGFIRVAAYRGSVAMNEGQLDLLKYLSKLNKPFVFSLFGSPYLLTFVPELPTYLLTYEYYPEAERAAARAVLGRIPISGKLPVSLPELYPIGHGIARPMAKATAEARKPQRRASKK